MLRRALLAVLVASLLVPPAGATWSIVVVNRRTGEVAVGAATCIPRINLLNGLATVVPGVGGGVVQASGSSDDLVPMTIGLRAGLSPADILDLVIAAEPSPNLLQTGIVALYPGAPVTFTGRGVGRAKSGVVGQVGDLAFAIQGNVLTGAAVVQAARTALLGTEGDLGQKLLAAMQAARELGGDGRCSCDLGDPDGCGAPPDDFEKSAHVGFLVLARVGDTAPPCVDGNDCGDGSFYMRLNVRGADAAENDPDPVEQLAQRYATWRANRSGRPDGLRSRVEAIASLPADGLTRRTVIVRLVDVDGVGLTSGGADVTVAPVDNARLHVRLGPVQDRGDGTYRFQLTSTRSAGTDRLVITARDGVVRATLYPYLEVRSVPPAELHVGVDRLSAAAGGTAPFVIAQPEFGGGAYVLVATTGGAVSASLGRAGLPSLVRGRSWVFPGTRGVLDEMGRAEAELVAPPGALTPLIGTRLSWSAVLATGTRVTTTETVGFDVLP